MLGTQPASGKNIYVKIDGFGPLAQIGETEDEDKKGEKKASPNGKAAINPLKTSILKHLAKRL
jgi:topoisomerase IA-like protein